MSYSSTARLVAMSSFDACIGAGLRYDAVLAEVRLTAETRFDPQSGPAAATWAVRSAPRPGRAAAPGALRTTWSVAPRTKRMSLDGLRD